MVAEQAGELVDADPDNGKYYATYHYPSSPPSTAVPLALAELTGREATDLDPLYRTASVDGDALDALFDPETSRGWLDGRVTFTYCDYTVIVKSHGRIVILSPPSAANAIDER